MSLGLTMFLKAFILALWAAFLESWKAYKAKRRADGLPLILNRNGVYVPDDRLEKIELWVTRAFWTAVTLFALYAVYVTYWFLVDAGAI